jgi:hypothetical protein
MSDGFYPASQDNRDLIRNQIVELGVRKNETEEKMAGVKFIVIYPRPNDIDAFEKVYQGEHVPMAVEKLGGKTKIVATKVLASPQGKPPFYRIVEGPFPVDGSSGGLRCLSRGEGDIGPCRVYLQRRKTYLFGR